MILVVISAECEDLLCPFLKSTPIALRRVNIDEDAIEVKRKVIPTTASHQTVSTEDLFKYDEYFHDRIEAKKRDNSYRIFKRVQRQSGSFPRAQEKKNLDDDIDSRTITVWCSNDYLGLGQHPKLKQAVM